MCVLASTVLTNSPKSQWLPIANVCFSPTVLWTGCWWTGSAQTGLQARGWVQGCTTLHSRAQAGGPAAPGVCSSHARWQGHKSRAETLLETGTWPLRLYSTGRCRSHGEAERQWGGEGKKESFLENDRICHSMAAASDARWRWCPFLSGSGPRLCQWFWLNFYSWFPSQFCERPSSLWYIIFQLQLAKLGFRSFQVRVLNETQDFNSSLALNVARWSLAQCLSVSRPPIFLLWGWVSRNHTSDCLTSCLSDGRSPSRQRLAGRKREGTSLPSVLSWQQQLVPASRFLQHT